MNIWNQIEIDGTPVLYSPDAASDERESRLALCAWTARQLERGLGLLGIQTVARM